MPPLSSLGTFLTLSFLLPGIIIFSALVLLFPESYALIEKRSTIELVALVLVIAFLNGHLAFIFEICVLNRVWAKMYPTLDLTARSKIMSERSQILAEAEINGFAHAHFDAIFGEFVLFTNSSFWVLLISLSKLFFSRSKADLAEALLTLVSSLVILLFTSPLFKHQYLAALETIKSNNTKRAALAADKETKSSKDGEKKEDKLDIGSADHPKQEGDEQRNDALPSVAEVGISI